MTNKEFANRRTGWHVVKDIPVAIILTLFVQFMGGVWWTAKLDARMTANELAVSQQAASGASLRSEVSDLKGKVIEIGTKMDILLSQGMKDGK